MNKDKRKKRIRITVVLLHLAVWVILFIIPNYVAIWQEENEAHFYFYILKKTAFYALLFYLNYVFLVPRLFFRNRKIVYYLVAAVSTILLFFASEIVLEKTRPVPDKSHRFPEHKIHPADSSVDSNEVMFKEKREPHRPPPRWPVTYSNLLIYFLLCGAGLGLRFADKIRETEGLRREAEKEKINTELEMLKSRIHPHFFFNTLNNIYALTESKSPLASDAILKLSRLMRYVIYDSQQGTTLLSKEFEFISNYIELMRLRLTSKINLDIHFPESYNDSEIHPLIFISFIENAFKHGISYSHPSFITIHFDVGNHFVDFTCRNSTHDTITDVEHGHSGQGLENVFKRLELLYPGLHTLNITNAENVFEVKLKIITGNENQNADNRR